MGSGNPAATHWSMPFLSLSDVRISGFAAGREIAICQSAKHPRMILSLLSYPIPRSFRRQPRNLTCRSPKHQGWEIPRVARGFSGVPSMAWTLPIHRRHRDPEELYMAEAAKINLAGFCFRSKISVLNLDSLPIGVQATLPAWTLHVK